MRVRETTYRAGLFVVLAMGAVYCLWLGAHWLALPLSGQELAGSASRVWDVKRELSEHGRVPWWTPYFMGGSSYGINHARGFYLVPWMVLSWFMDLMVAGKVMLLLAMFMGAVGMYVCGRYFLRHTWGAILAAAVYLLHPGQLHRVGGNEHVTIALFMAFVPWLWWSFARALDSGRARDAMWCALVATGAFWADNKQAMIMGVFLAGYFVFHGVRMWVMGDAGRDKPGEKNRNEPESGRDHRVTSVSGLVRQAVLMGITAACLGAILILPGWMESRHVQLFHGGPMAQWQGAYAFKSVLGVVDRDGVVMRSAIEGVMRYGQQTQFQDVAPMERMKVQQRINWLGGMRMDSPEKYAGVALCAAAVAAALWNRRRADRWTFWFFVGMLMLSFMLATGPLTVAGAHWQSMMALLGTPGVGSNARMAVWLGLAAVVAVLVLFFRAKVTSEWKLVLALLVLGVFLFVPGFRLLSAMPLFGDIRAPFAFYDVPSIVCLAMLAGFFVTDVLAGDKRWESNVPLWVGIGVVLLVADYWPYQRLMKQARLPATVEANVRGAYETVGKDKEWGQCLALSGRYYHLLGTVWSGKPQADEAFYKWMSPWGMGLLNDAKWNPISNLPSFLNVANVRYVVFEKTDPDAHRGSHGGLLERLRQTFPEVVVENADVVVFRNDMAHGYVKAYPLTDACLFVGDDRESAAVALGLTPILHVLVHAKESRLSDLNFAQLPPYKRVYVTGEEILHAGLAPPEWRGRVMAASSLDRAARPETMGRGMALDKLHFERENAGRVRIRAESKEECWLTVAESWFPYWRAEMDGAPVELLKINCGLMGVRMPAGQHELVLCYETPVAYRVAGGISGLALLLVAAVLWVDRSKRERVVSSTS